MSAPVDYIARTRALYDSLGYPPYRWVRNDDAPPFSVPAKPMREWRVALIGSGGIYVRGQRAFHFQDDPTFRVVPTGVDISELRVTHFAYDLDDARSDPNAVFPIERLRDLAADGVIGSLTDEHYGFVGGLYSVRKCRDELAPALVERVVAHEADVALLVPV